MKEEAVGSVRNAEGGTKTDGGMSVGEWTSGTCVAKESRNPTEGARRLRPSGGFEAVKYSGEEAKLTRG